MSRYIDIDSTFRDRITYPKPGDFVVQVGGAPKTTYQTASDPVLLAFPYETDLLSGGSTLTQIALSVVASTIVNFYAGSVIDIAGEFRTVTAYDNTAQIATVDPPMSVAYPALTPYYIRKQYPVALAGGAYQDVTLVVNPTPTSIQLGALASSLNDIYVNKFVFFPDPLPSNFKWRRITSYNGATKIATLDKAFTAPIAIGTVYQIIEFSYDNARPLVFNGTELVQNPVNQKISLLNLIVPTAKILGGYGGTLENYPFVYVTLYSEKGNTWLSPVESNNPTSRKALFKVPVTFLPNASWLTLQGSFMSHIIQFRENDNLHFSVFLPNGDILDFYPSSTYTYFQSYKFPVVADPGNQIQAVFEVTRSF